MLRVITGKPGTGKTYHAVNALLIPQIVDWCQYEDRSGEKFARSLYTNLPLNLDYIDSELAKRHNIKAKPSSYLNLISLDSKTDEKGELIGFWEDIPDNALLIFDEVHHALGSEVDVDLEIKWRNYVSTHRHKHHDIILLTQHIENVTKDILRMCEEVIDLQNVKTGRIPYFQVPLADIYSVLRVFGYSQQTYIASYGRVVSRSIKWENRNETFTINKKDFGFYNTHVHGSEGSSDSPDLNFTKSQALRWFFRKHLGKIIIRIGIIVFIFFFAINVLKNMPNILSSAIPSFDSSKANISKTRELSSSKNLGSLESEKNLTDEEKLALAKEKVKVLKKQLPFNPVAIINNVVFSQSGKKYRIGDKIEDLDTTLISVDAKNGIITLENETIFYIK